ncbi:MAG: DUF2163 domain-containing protein [Pseudomonadota bacterium]
MRDVPQSLRATLGSGAATVCRCVRLTRTDGVVIALTDHDAPLEVDGSLFEPSGGFEASEATSAVGPVVGELDLVAAMSDDRLSTADLAAGRFDGAKVEMLLVNWADPAAFLRQTDATLGDVSARDGTFHAEVRGPFAAYDATRGRIFSARCDAQLGDGRCGVDLNDPAQTGSGSLVSRPTPNALRLSGLSGFAAGAFNGGTAHWSGQPPLRVRRHLIEDDAAIIELWHAPPSTPQTGTLVTVTAGCDKRFATCRDRFENAANFRGFPHMPGDDFALSYPASDDGNLDGGSRNGGGS